MNDKLTIGKLGEDSAAEYLKKRCGYSIVARNVRFKTGEIDIIAREGKTLVFVEVKARACHAYRQAGEQDEFQPEQHLDERKARKLRMLCKLYLMNERYSENTDWRIDLVAVIVDDEGRRAQIRHYKNAVGE